MYLRGYLGPIVVEGQASKIFANLVEAVGGNAVKTKAGIEIAQPFFFSLLFDHGKARALSVAQMDPFQETGL